MRKNYFLYTTGILLIFGIVLSGITSLHTTSDDSFQPIDFQREQNIVLAFVNYDPSYFDFQEFYSYFPSSIDKTVQIDLGGGLLVTKTISYQLNYDIVFANESYAQDLDSFVDTIAITNATTSYLNTANLQLQRSDGMPRDIFDELQGTAIPADQVEQYLSENPIQTILPKENTYFLYALNFSRFDTDTRDHWFNVTQIDPDSQRARFSWLLNWDFPENYDVKFPYQAYSSQERLIYFDPTAYSWYLQWVSIWKNISPAPPLAYTNDLDHLLEGLRFEVKQLVVSQVMGEWVKELIQGGFNISPVKTMQIPSTMQIDIRVFNNLSTFNLSTQDLSWTINKDLIVQELSILNPLANTITLNVTFTDLNDDPRIIHLLNNTEYFFSEREALQLDTSNTETNGFMPPPPNPPKPIPIEHYRYFKADELHENLINLDNDYFSPSNANITVHGFLFLTDNASLTVVQDDRSYQLLTSYSTPQHFTALMELDRLYMPDHTTEKAGLTHLLLKTILHSINLADISNVGVTKPPIIDNVMLHAGGSEQGEQDYMASFINTLMSEYAYETGFARVQYDALLRLTADQWYEQAAYNFSILFSEYQNGTKGLEQRLQLATTLANNYQTAYNNQDYINALLNANYLLQVLLTGEYIPTTTGIIPPSTTGPLPTTTIITTTEEPDRSRTVMEIPTETSDNVFNILGASCALIVVLFRVQHNKRK